MSSVYVVPLKTSDWLGTDIIDLGATPAEPYNGQLSSINYQPNNLTQSRVFISDNNVCSTKQATIYTQTNGRDKGGK